MKFSEMGADYLCLFFQKNGFFLLGELNWEGIRTWNNRRFLGTRLVVHFSYFLGAFSYVSWGIGKRRRPKGMIRCAHVWNLWIPLLSDTMPYSIREYIMFGGGVKELLYATNNKAPHHTTTLNLIHLVTHDYNPHYTPKPSDDLLPAPTPPPICHHPTMMLQQPAVHFSHPPLCIR